MSKKQSKLVSISPVSEKEAFMNGLEPPYDDSEIFAHDKQPAKNIHYKSTARNVLLAEANSIVSGDRESAYGIPENSFDSIAKIWQVILKTEVTPQQVALCMVALKVVRATSSPNKSDNYVDMAGYAAIAGELGMS